MNEKHLQRKWDREEVVVLVVEYFRTKTLSNKEIDISIHSISDFLRKREMRRTGHSIPEVYRDFAGVKMQFGRIKCLDPETEYSGMIGTKLQKEIVKEYLMNPQSIIAEAEKVYNKYPD